MSNLKGLRVLLVRPGSAFGQSETQDRDHFSSQLIDDGVVLHHYPVMTVSPLISSPEIDQIKSYILNFALYDKVLFVSRTAARLALDWLDRYWSVPEGLPVGTRYYAVGKSTAAELKKWHIEAELPIQAYSSEGLLALPSLQKLPDERVLIFSGVGGRQLLSEELSCRGAAVSQCSLYRRQPTDVYAGNINSLLLSTELDLVIVHSGELLSNLMSLVPKEQQQVLWQLPLFVPSERVCELARDAGFNNVICAGSALPEDMVSALRGWYSNKIK
ncbi:MAG: uroporphyrinogen-III synthase [Porticoccus sp.]|nr:uroporphyrinogen-III synthase [Porticoccus sp.]